MSNDTADDGTAQHPNPNMKRREREVREALKAFPDLYSANPNNSLPGNIARKSASALSGTIPIVQKGVTYNIPIQIYLLDSFPDEAPMCYVTPTPNMWLRSTKHVDARDGRVLFPYLAEWDRQWCDLTNLLQIIVMEFQDHCPIFANKGENSAQLSANQKEAAAKQLDHALSVASSKYPDMATMQVMDALSIYKDLHPGSESYMGGTRNFVSLCGTVPVAYRNSKYNFPVKLCLSDRFPMDVPACYVHPIPGMVIKATECVNPHDGRISLPYLSEWHHERCSLTDLLQIIVVEFQEHCPLFSKMPNRSPATQVMPNHGGEEVQIQLDEEKKKNLELQSEVDKLRGAAALCPVCMDGKCALLFQCGHLFCETCGNDQRIVDCPLCKKPITGRQKVFM